MFDNNRIIAHGQLFEINNIFLASTVAHRDGNVAQKSGMFRSRNWRTTKSFAKFLFRYSCELREVRIHEQLIGPEVRVRSDRSFAIPRANVLADVATEDVSTDLLAHFFWNRSSLLDREIRDAS